MKQSIQEAVVRREFDHSYLLIKAEISQIESYPFLMITQNNITGLLTCRLRYMEDIAYYSYDITSKKPLVQEYLERKLHFEEIRELFYHISAILKGAEEFLLEKEGFLLSPDYIYKDLETEEVFCLYLPDIEEDKEEERGRYRELADFLLDKVDHKDEHGVNCVYQFYKMSKESYFSFDAFLGFIEKEEVMFQAEKRKSDERKQAEGNGYIGLESKGDESEISQEMILKETKMKESRSKTGWMSVIVLTSIGALLILLYLFVPYLRYFALYLLLPGISLMVAALIFATRNLYGIYQSRKESDWILPTEEVTVEEYFDDILDNETVYFEEEFSYHLKWREGHFSKEFYLKEFPVTVGKMKGSVGLYIEDASVSRLHACFKEQGKDVVLQDLDSTNGTYVNGKQLAPGEVRVINRSDEIQFGKIIVNVV